MSDKSTVCELLEDHFANNKTVFLRPGILNESFKKFVIFKTFNTQRPECKIYWKVSKLKTVKSFKVCYKVRKHQHQILC